MAIDSRNIFALIKAQYATQGGGPKPRRYSMGGKDNNTLAKSYNAAGTNMIADVGTDALNNLLYGNALVTPLATPIDLKIQANGKIATVNPFFVNANDTTNLEIVAITCIFSVAAGSTATGYVSKEVQGQAIPGTSCQSGTFNLNATANTYQTATLAGAMGYPSLVLAPGEQLTFNISAVASLAGLAVTVWVRPSTGVSIAGLARAANTDIVTLATPTFYLNLVPGQTVRAVAMRWSTAGTNSGTVTVDITKDVPTDVPGAGTSILSAAQSVKTTANTAVFPALSGTASVLKMNIGDRLTVKKTGTFTALAGLVIDVFFNSGPDQHIVVPFSGWDAPSTDRTVFVANQPLVVVDCWESWSTVSTSLTQLLTVDRGTTAPGAGTGLQTDNTNTGILTSGTINTPVGSVMLADATRQQLWLGAGDRLGIKNAGTAASVAGIVGSILLRKP